jgi:hypothetical protein
MVDVLQPFERAGEKSLLTFEQGHIDMPKRNRKAGRAIGCGLEIGEKQPSARIGCVVRPITMGILVSDGHTGAQHPHYQFVLFTEPGVIKGRAHKRVGGVDATGCCPQSIKHPQNGVEHANGFSCVSAHRKLKFAKRQEQSTENGRLFRVPFHGGINVVEFFAEVHFHGL